MRSALTRTFSKRAESKPHACDEATLLFLPDSIVASGRSAEPLVCASLQVTSLASETREESSEDKTGVWRESNGCVRQVGPRKRGASEPLLLQIGLAFTMDQLPNETLLQIFIQLDQPGPFAQVNKRLRALSQGTLWRPKWLMQRYVCYEVMFEAIARPRLFTVELFEMLLHKGVHCSKDLVQVLHTLRGDFKEGARDQWGVRIKLSAYAAILHYAAKQVSTDSNGGTRGLPLT